MLHMHPSRMWQGTLMKRGYCVPGSPGDCQAFPMVAGEIGTSFQQALDAQYYRDLATFFNYTPPADAYASVRTQNWMWWCWNANRCVCVCVRVFCTHVLSAGGLRGELRGALGERAPSHDVLPAFFTLHPCTAGTRAAWWPTTGPRSTGAS